MEHNQSQLILGQSDFATVAILMLLAAAVSGLILFLTSIIGPRRVGETKYGTYESGMDPIGDTRRRFNVRFYLIAVLFLIFDVEIVFLYPWAVLYPRLQDGQHAAWAEPLRAAGYTPGFMLAAMGIFFALLLVGLIYEWRRGVFKWN